jgi:cytolysin-activating lysine-acyltransferase
MRAKPINEQDNVSMALGRLIRIISKTKRAAFSLAEVNFQVSTPIRLNQIEFCIHNGGEPVGYIVWAFVSQRVFEKLVEDETYILHPSEWNEGIKCVVIDVVALNGCVLQLFRAFSRRIGKTHDQFWYIRRIGQKNKIGQIATMRA